MTARTQAAEYRFESRLPARITGIVFWGLVFIGMAVSMLLLQGAEKQLERENHNGVILLSYHIKEMLEQYPVDDPLSSRSEQIRQALLRDQDKVGFNGLVVMDGNDELRVGEFTDVDEIKTREITVMQPTGARDISLRVSFPDSETIKSAMRKNMLLTVGMGVIIFGLVLLQVLQRVLTRPFHDMVLKAQRFSEGDDAVRFDEIREDEFGYLGRFINNSLNTLLEQQEDLRLALGRASESEQELSREKEFAYVTLMSITEAVITVNHDHEIEYMNAAAERLLGVRLADVINSSCAQVVRLTMIGHDRVLEKALEEALDWSFECDEVIKLFDSVKLTSHAGDKHDVEATVAPMHKPDGEMIGGLVVIKDVSHARELTNQLTYQASHDMLTGLFNRRKFEEHLQWVLDHVTDEGRVHSLCYLDLDHFKIVNDTCGHVAGDELLKQLPEIFKQELRSGDVIARLGGDEFGVLLENCCLDRTLIIAEKLRQEVEAFRFSWENKSFQIGVSIGIVAIDAHNHQMSEVMSAADIACYAAKDSGRNRIHVYEPTDEMVNERHGQMHWISRITKALQHDGFELYLQPITPLTDVNEAMHYEVLVRMIEDEDVIQPGAFISAAERYKLMPGIDRWVITESFRRIAGSVISGSTVFSINLSGETIGEAGMYEFIIGQGERYGVDLSTVCFEITETAAISKISSARELMQQLGAHGCRFALDDFGSGLSSFGYLKSLPVDYLKIDGVFVRDIAHDVIDREMVSSICHIGKAMQLKTIAEHVENQETADLLREMGIDFVQGFYYGSPVLFDTEGHRRTG